MTTAVPGHSTPTPNAPLHLALARRAERAATVLTTLIDRLDTLHGDPDLEEEPDREDGGDDEPSLAGFGGLVGNTSDYEHEFGGLGDRHDQKRWAAEHADEGDGDPDAEDSDPGGCEHDGREPELAW